MSKGNPAWSIFSGRLTTLWRNGAPDVRVGLALLRLDFIAHNMT
jgi:hypothetical protein